MAHIMLFPTIHALYFHISTFRSTCIVPSVSVFFSSLILCFPGMLLRYCLFDLEMVTVAPIVTGIAFVFILLLLLLLLLLGTN